MFLLNNIIQLLYSGFAETIILLFILRLFLKKRKQLWSDLFLLSNCMLLGASVLYGLAFMAEYLYAWLDQVSVHMLAFRWRITGPYWFTYWTLILLTICAPQVFWFKRIRKSEEASLLMVPVINVGLIIELSIIYSSRFREIYFGTFRSYRPSFWVYYPPGLVELLAPLSVFSALLSLLYFRFRSNRRKHLFKNAN